jgi:hypothetical protein
MLDKKVEGHRHKLYIHNFVQCLTSLIISRREKSTITQQIDLTERIYHRTYSSHKTINWNVALFCLKPEWFDSNCLQTQISSTHTDKHAPPTNKWYLLWWPYERQQHTYGFCWLRRGGDELFFDIMPDMNVNKETIFSLLRHNISKYLPPLDCMSHQNDSQRLWTYLNCKGTGPPHPCWPLGRPSYMDWSEFHQSSDISFLQTVSLSLFCM